MNLKQRKKSSLRPCFWVIPTSIEYIAILCIVVRIIKFNNLRTGQDHKIMCPDTFSSAVAKYFGEQGNIYLYLHGDLVKLSSPRPPLERRWHGYTRIYGICSKLWARVKIGIKLCSRQQATITVRLFLPSLPPLQPYDENIFSLLSLTASTFYPMLSLISHCIGFPGPYVNF